MTNNTAVLKKHQAPKQNEVSFKYNTFLKYISKTRNLIFVYAEGFFTAVQMIFTQIVI